uniref:Expressed protein n=1 Tax=Oryza sativa subsp. japonica TaxID=39947 RepID=Q10PP4_ORYSJ|nr:expressed protein [Oryza sativa Japonica Group]
MASASASLSLAFSPLLLPTPRPRPYSRPINPGFPTPLRLSLAACRRGSTRSTPCSSATSPGWVSRPPRCSSRWPRDAPKVEELSSFWIKDGKVWSNIAGNILKL